MIRSIKSDKLNLHDWWDIPVAYHPTNTEKIIINIPGAGGSIDGYKSKYRNLGSYLQEKEIASLVRIPNDRPQEPILTARTVINYTLDNSKEICGREKPELWLMGVSVGVAAILLTAWEYPEISKILVINPFIDFRSVREDVKKYLPRFEGEVFLAIGDEDTTDPKDRINYLKEYCNDISSYIIPNCDHQLTGEKNVRILSQLPEYFFLGKYRNNELPNGEKGVDLLDE